MTHPRGLLDSYCSVPPKTPRLRLMFLYTNILIYRRRRTLVPLHQWQQEAPDTLQISTIWFKLTGQPVKSSLLALRKFSQLYGNQSHIAGANIRLNNFLFPGKSSFVPVQDISRSLHILLMALAPLTVTRDGPVPITRVVQKQRPNSPGISELVVPWPGNNKLENQHTWHRPADDGTRPHSPGQRPFVPSRAFRGPDRRMEHDDWRAITFHICWGELGCSFCLFFPIHSTHGVTQVKTLDRGARPARRPDHTRGATILCTDLKYLR